MLNTQNADLLYTAAVSRVQSEVSAQAMNLSPVAKACFDVASDVVMKVGTTVAKQIGAAVVDEIGAALGPEIVNAVTGVANDVANMAASVASEIPILGQAISIATNMISMAESEGAASAAVYAAECQNALNRPVIGSGTPPLVQAGTVTPADIFALDPDMTAVFMGNGPYSSLGICFVGLTECDETADDTTDAPLLHSPDAYDRIRASYIALVPGEPNVGIPQATRKTLGVLRRAMGSHNADQGVTLWPIYLDLISKAFQAGHLTDGFAKWVLAWYWRSEATYGSYGPPYGLVPDSPHGANPRGDGSPGPYCGFQWAPLIKQVESIVKNWDVMQASKAAALIHKAPLKLNFSGMIDPVVSALRKASRAPYGFDMHVTPAARVAIALRAQAAHAAAVKSEIAHAAARGAARAAAKAAAKS